MNVARNPVPHRQSARARAGHRPDLVPLPPRGRPLSLADGALGETLLEVELALSGFGSWDEVIKAFDPVSVAASDLRGDGAMPEGLFYGAPAAAFVLDAADVDGSARYARVLAELDKVVDALTQARLVEASERRQSRVPPLSDEIDLFNGLIGLGVLLLRRAPRGRTLGQVVAHVVDLTRDVPLEGARVPGWWTSPDRFVPQEGYAGLGMVQGAAGLLAFLAIAARAGRQVPRGAFTSLIGWLDAWRQAGPDGPWWPDRVSLDELRTGRTTQVEPSAPTWAGTVGIARALQMAAIATGETAWRTSAEHVLVSCLSPRLLDQLTEPGLVDGTAGVYATAFRAAQDAASPLLRQRLTTAADALARTGRGWVEDATFLIGRSGTRLVNQILLRHYELVSGADRCLLIAWAHK